MKKQQTTYIGCILALLVAGLWFASCTPSPDPKSVSASATALYESALLTATNAIKATATVTPTPLPTATATATPTPTRTPGPPPTLPPTYTSSLLKAGAAPQAYVKDTCEYIKNRWDPNNAEVGTVVMPIMYHSVSAEYRTITENSQITTTYLEQTLRHAKEVGFQTITTRQLVDFLEKNAKIPRRSLFLIVDDRRPGVVREGFWQYLENNKWTLTLGWLIGDTDQKVASRLGSVPNEPYKTLWEQMEAYNASGMLDVQAHGYIHNENTTEASSEAFMKHELVDSRKVIQDHFYCKDYKTGKVDPNCKTDQPLAYIWPGGSFTKRGVEIAREAGYHLGFTVNPRGPLMYNWIPLAAKADPNYPSYIPEMPVNDPLMVLPRYWSTDAAGKIDEVITIGKEAAAAAGKTRDAELEYYRAVCYEKTGPIPNVVP